jgi:integrative and conjugative element protein (TIGR02256 family)
LTWTNIKYGLTISIEDNTLNELLNIGKKHFPNEFGGFLVGYYSDDNKHLNITNHILPNKYNGTPVLFERETVGIASQLKTHFSETPQKYYVGEWHTHPMCVPFPSGTDFAAMKDIAENKAVAIKNPALIIIGHQYSINNIGVYAFFDSKLYQYE